MERGHKIGFHINTSSTIDITELLYIQVGPIDIRVNALEIGLDSRFMNLEARVAHTQQALDTPTDAQFVTNQSGVAHADLGVSIHIQFLIINVADIVGVVIGIHAVHVAHK